MTDVVWGLVLFMVAGTFMVLAALVAGKFLRPALYHPDKAAPYECGEPTIGPNWVQFDLRFYVVALVFVVFDVEIALFYPWAVVFKEAGLPAVFDMLFFFSILGIGYLYLWRFGYLDWVRSTSAQARPGERLESGNQQPETGAS
jgi:NADH-quinone oxidoreductase subunit A